MHRPVPGAVISPGRLFTPLLPFIFVFLFIWVALATIPAPPQLLGTGLDASWGYALNLAHAQNLVFGRDVVFTYGPLGYLIAPDPELVSPFPVLVCNWAIYGMFLFGLLLIWRALGHVLVAAVSWIVLVMAMLLVPAPFERMQIAFLTVAIGIVGLLVRFGRAPFACVIAGLAAGLMLLVKVNEGISAWCVFYAVLAGLALIPGTPRPRAWRSIAILACIPPFTLLLGFVAVEHNALMIWPYLVRSLQVSSGYSEAMAMPGHMYQAALGVIGMAALSSIIPAIVEQPQDLLKGILPALLAGFFAFKGAMVRQDDMHADLLQMKLAGVGVFLLVCARARRDQRLLISFVLVGAFYSALVLREELPGQSQLAWSRMTLRDIAGLSSANWHFASTWNNLRAQTHQGLEAKRVDNAVSAAVSRGTVDSLPIDIEVVAANGWRWNPRPVFQSYSAYTPMLDSLNAEHLASAQSPDHIIMRFVDIDGRQPLLDDAGSWRALFGHYDIQLTRPDLFVLRRRASSRYSEPRFLGSVTSAWNTDVAVPALKLTEFAMMRAEIDKSLWGMLEGLLFRNSAIYVSASSQSGKQLRWRVTRANLIDGALVGHLPEDLSQTAPYFGELGAGLPDRIASIRFETPGTREFSNPIRISWYAVQFRPGEAHYLAEPRLTLTQLWKPGQPVAVLRASADSKPDELVVRPTQFDPSLTFNIARNLRQYKTLVLRARFSKAGRINLFFGRQSEGRGIEGNIPVVNRWINIYLNTAANRFWGEEAGMVLRFDPPDESAGSAVELAGLWAATTGLGRPEQMLFYDAQPSAPETPSSQSAAGVHGGTSPSGEPQSHPLNKTTIAYIDSVDGKPHTSEPIETRVSSTLDIGGWAIDTQEHHTASAVFIDIDGRLFPTSYGMERSDVAAALKDPVYTKSGFTVRIPMGSAGPGHHTISLRVVNASRTGYYSGPSLQLNVH